MLLAGGSGAISRLCERRLMTATNQLPREEYIEQEYFFKTYRERLKDSVPSQDILKTIQEELLNTCRLPVAIDILRTEIMHSGQMGPAMRRLPHYFTSFQTFVIEQAEDDKSRFEQIAAFQILEREARYRGDDVSPSGLFMYQLECIARNRLGYHSGLSAMAADKIFDADWKTWFQYLTLQLGVHDLADLVYRASEYYQIRRRTQAADTPEGVSQPVLFENQTGRIARANIGRDPVYFFSALQRQLNYPSVPLPPRTKPEQISPIVESRLIRMEQRLKLLEMEQRDGIDLTQFYGKHRSMDEGDTASS